LFLDASPQFYELEIIGFFATTTLLPSLHSILCSCNFFLASIKFGYARSNQLLLILRSFLNSFTLTCTSIFRSNFNQPYAKLKSSQGLVGFAVYISLPQKYVFFLAVPQKYVLPSSLYI